MFTPGFLHCPHTLILTCCPGACICDSFLPPPFPFHPSHLHFLILLSTYHPGSLPFLWFHTTHSLILHTTCFLFSFCCFFVFLPFSHTCYIYIPPHALHSLFYYHLWDMFFFYLLCISLPPIFLPLPHLPDTRSPVGPHYCHHRLGPGSTHTHTTVSHTCLSATTPLVCAYACTHLYLPQCRSTYYITHHHFSHHTCIPTTLGPYCSAPPVFCLVLPPPLPPCLPGMEYNLYSLF